MFFDLSSRRAVYFTGYTERETGEHHVLAYSAATATCYAEGDSSCSRSRSGDLRPHACSFLAHATDINDLLEGLDGVLKDGLDGLHDTESSFHIVDLWLHALDGLHLSGDLNEGLSIIESLEDSGSEGLLDVLDGSGLGNGGIGITTGLGGESGGEGGLEVDEEVIFVHGVLSVGSNGGEEGSGERHL